MTASLRPVAGDPGDVLGLLEPWVHFGGKPLVVSTSGTTGEPKDVALSQGAILASARASLARLGGPGQWLLALPVTSIAGVQVLVRSILGGWDPVVLADRDSLESAMGSFGEARKYAAIVPTQLFRLATTDRLHLLSGFDAVLVGGASVDAELLAEARAAGAPIVRTYGMTETCGGCVYDGIPLDGVSMRIDEDDESDGDGSGQIWLHGPVLFDGYVGERRQDEWFATADRGRLLDDGTLQVLGRLDETIVSGGVNIPLPAVERALRKVDGVVDAAAVGVADHEWGTRVVAAVVPAEDGAVNLAALRDALQVDGAPRSWAPRQLLTLAELPLLPGGKVDRERLRVMAADA